MIFGNLTKSSHNPPQQHNKQAIESAMSELGKQTDELLQAPIMEQPKPKPELPQRRIIPHSRGSSLDIVGHSASRMKQFEAKPVDEAQELLPQKAGYSYNEKPENAHAVELPQQVSSDMASVIKPSQEVVTEGSSSPMRSENSQLESIAQDEHEKPEPPLPEKISYTPVDALISSIKTEEDVPTQANETELIATQKADIFDVNDYHSELPPPSKVQKSYTWLYIVVAFLLLLMCALIFLTLTSQLPA